jgi:uncharacterized membrane protein YfcA
MPDPKILLLAALLALTAAFVLFWIAQERARPRPGPLLGGWHTLVGFITDFLDTLGIGSFAVTTTIYRLWKMVPDQNIPGTLNVGHALPTVVQALIYITIIQVQFETLALLILSAVGGSWIGASIVAALPKRSIQRGMGLALAVAAVLMTLTALNRMPGGGDALALTGGRLVVACAITFILGALMTLGIGAYAPIMIMVSLLGMNPTAAFPIMMGACAFLMPAASAQFIRKARYDLRASFGLALGGMPGVLLAAYVFTSLPVPWVRWLVVVVVIYASTTLLRASALESADTPGEPEGSPLRT